jgi:hypothetical protein
MARLYSRDSEGLVTRKLSKERMITRGTRKSETAKQLKEIRQTLKRPIRNNVSRRRRRTNRRRTRRKRQDVGRKMKRLPNLTRLCHPLRTPRLLPSPKACMVSWREYRIWKQKANPRTKTTWSALPSKNARDPARRPLGGGLAIV